MVRGLPVLLLCSVLLTACHHAEAPPQQLTTVPLTIPRFPPTAAEARSRLAGLTVEWGRNGLTYTRARFGGTWSDGTDAPGGRNGCDTRDDVLHRDLTVVERGDPDACAPLSGTLYDPYTGKDLAYRHRRASQIRTGHVVPLGAAWRAGAWEWSPEKRLRYANDLDVLLAVEKQANHEKGSKTPDKWKPRREFWCEYARRWTGIKVKYALSVTPPEKGALDEMLGTCPGPLSP